MIIIADSGTTKTEWAVISKHHSVKKTQTASFNPYFIDQKFVEESVIENDLLNELKDKTLRIFFYSAGCGNDSNKRILSEILMNVFWNARIVIESDLLGAARGLLQTNQGIIAVLGTGSNSGFYNGKEIVQKQPSLGYVLGDEGSGNAIGKSLLRAYAYKEMPERIEKKFEQQFGRDIQYFIQRLYKDPFPGYYLASFVPFCVDYKKEEFIRDLIEVNFTSFFEHHILKYSNKGEGLCFAGSVAWAFKDVLHDVSNKNKVSINCIEKSPLQSLVDYHYSLSPE